MKKIMIMVAMTISLVFAYGQRPCNTCYKINNGGGNCSNLNGLPPTGSVTLSFNGSINPHDIPVITSVVDITDPNNPALVTDIYFGIGVIKNNGDVKYCYYPGPNNNNNLQGGNKKFMFTIAYSGNLPCESVLATKFISFTAKIERNNSVTLNWTVAEESNKGYAVERLVGKDWKQIASIEPKTGSTNDYVYIDNTAPNSGVIQYRLAEITLDGNNVYSKIIALKSKNQVGNVSVYPNPCPVSGQLTILFEDLPHTHSVFIYDMSGRMLKPIKDVTNSSIQINNLRPGTYILKVVSSSGDESIQRIVVN